MILEITISKFSLQFKSIYMSVGFLPYIGSNTFINEIRARKYFCRNHTPQFIYDRFVLLISLMHLELRALCVWSFQSSSWIYYPMHSRLFFSWTHCSFFVFIYFSLPSLPPLFVAIPYIYISLYTSVFFLPCTPSLPKYIASQTIFSVSTPSYIPSSVRTLTRRLYERKYI